MTENKKSDFATRLPELLPQALAWAEEQSRTILCYGQPLDARGVAVARAVGVADPNGIRILPVPHIPAPKDPELRRLALEQNLIGPGTTGLTLGSGIFIVEGHWCPPLLSHECRHVHQVEVAGSMTAFLTVYLKQIANVGYRNAPYEIDARARELQFWPEV